MIPVDESKKEEMTLALSSALTELVVDSKEDTQISGDGEGIEKKEWKKKDVSESLIPIDDPKRK